MYEQLIQNMTIYNFFFSCFLACHLHTPLLNWVHVLSPHYPAHNKPLIIIKKHMQETGATACKYPRLSISFPTETNDADDVRQAKWKAVTFELRPSILACSLWG